MSPPRGRLRSQTVGEHSRDLSSRDVVLSGAATDGTGNIAILGFGHASVGANCLSTNYSCSRLLAPMVTTTPLTGRDRG
jgi:hypothetical protein